MHASRARQAPPNGKSAPVTHADDYHTTLGGLIFKAAKATDNLEKMLAVCRALMCFVTNLARPGRGFTSTPVVILGYHNLSSRELGERYRGDPSKSFLQELCGYDPADRPTSHDKLNDPRHTDVAKMYVEATPVSRAKVRKESIISPSTTAYIEVSFEGQGVVQLHRYSEEYTFTLPSLLLTDPLNKECPLDFDGKLMVSCPTTGLTASLKFKPWQDHAVKGYITKRTPSSSSFSTTSAIISGVSRSSSMTEERVAKLEGTWDGQLLAEGLEQQTSGVLFEAADYQPPIPYPATINLAEPGPRLLTRFWAAILESILYTDLQHASTVSKKVGEMVAMLTLDHMTRCLLYEVPQGPKSAKSLSEGGESGLLTQDKRPLPPAAKLQRAQGRALKYQLQYSVKAVGPEEDDDFTFDTLKV